MYKYQRGPNNLSLYLTTTRGIILSHKSPNFGKLLSEKNKIKKNNLMTYIKQKNKAEF